MKKSGAVALCCFIMGALIHLSLFNEFGAFVEYTKDEISNWYVIDGLEWFDLYFGSRFCREYETKLWIGLFFYMLGIVLYIILYNNRKSNKDENMTDLSKELFELKKLFEGGFLTEEEFSRAKNKLLEESKNHVYVSKNKRTKMCSVISYIAAFLLCVVTIWDIFFYSGIGFVHGFMALVILTLIFGKKDIYLFFSIGAIEIYLFVCYLIKCINLVIKCSRYEIPIDWSRIFIIPNVLILSTYFLLCLFAIKKNKNIIRKLWFVPGGLYISAQIITYVQRNMIPWPLKEVALWIFGNTIQAIAILLIGYLVCHDRE